MQLRIPLEIPTKISLKIKGCNHQSFENSFIGKGLHKSILCDIAHIYVCKVAKGRLGKMEI